MAFEYFVRDQVDIAVIEVVFRRTVGLNQYHYPEVSLITNIGYDHMDILGDTLPEIVFEKRASSSKMFR